MISEKKINLLGEEVTIRFNMAVEIAYEEITDTPFSASSLTRQKDCLALGMAAIVTNKPDTKITLDKLLHEASGKEMAELNSALAETMSAWFEIPKVMEKESEADSQEAKKSDESEEKPKN